MRHYNKLLALLLAMVMALGMTATAFAEEDKQDADIPSSAMAPAGDEDAKDDAAAPAGDAADTDADAADNKDDAAAAMNYSDVTDKNWYYGAVEFVTENKLMDGLTETTFGPSEDMTRQMLAVALYRLAGSPEVTAENPFTDVADDAAYKDAVVWAYSVGVVTGVTDTTFVPDSSIQRQAIAAMLARYISADTNADTSNLDAFSDADAIQNYAKSALSWAVANELIQGTDGAVNPRSNATRAQVATILQRFAPLAADKAPAAAPAEGDADKADTADTTPADDAAAAGDAEDKEAAAPAGQTEDGEKDEAGSDAADTAEGEGDQGTDAKDDAASDNAEGNQESDAKDDAATDKAAE